MTTSTIELATLWQSLKHTWTAWAQRIEQRQLLANMDDRDLRDMGITRADAIWAARTPFWRD
jgi:uncharacterized protein YjiS (DUF1127 family)